MKIEKGKLYKDAETGKLSVHFESSDIWTDKIAVHCPTKEDWEYVNKIMEWKWEFSPNHLIRLLDSEFCRLYDIQEAKERNYHIIPIDEFKKFYPEQHVETKGSFRKIVDLTPSNDDLLNNYGDEIKSYLDDQKVFNPQPHYDNSKGSLYKVATERNWNAYLFDVVKRIERGGKKDPLRQEIEKSIDVLKIWLNELD